MFEVGGGSILKGINGNVSFTVIIFFIYTFTIFFYHTSYMTILDRIEVSNR